MEAAGRKRGHLFDSAGRQKENSELQTYQKNGECLEKQNSQNEQSESKESGKERNKKC